MNEFQIEVPKLPGMIIGGVVDSYTREQADNKFQEKLTPEQLENVANAIKGTARGQGTVVITDISPIEHVMNVKVRSKNLIPYSRDTATQTTYGITVTNNGDGSVTLNGTATNYISFVFLRDIKVDIGETYIMSGNPTALPDVYLYMMDVQALGGGTICGEPLKAEYDKYAIWINIPGGTICDNVVIKPQLEIGTEITEYAPYVDPQSVILTSDNNETYIPEADGTVNGIKSSYPVTTLSANKEGVVIECEYNKDVNKVVEDLDAKVTEMEEQLDGGGTSVTGVWELISSGELTEEVSKIILDGFSCSRIALSIRVKGSSTNSEESSLQIRTNVSTAVGGGSDTSLARMLRTNPNAAATPAWIFLEMQKKWIAGQLANASVKVNYFNSTEYDSITGIYLSPNISGCVFGVGTTYELWGVRE